MVTFSSLTPEDTTKGAFKPSSVSAAGVGHPHFGSSLSKKPVDGTHRLPSVGGPHSHFGRPIGQHLGVHSPFRKFFPFECNWKYLAIVMILITTALIIALTYVSSKFLFISPLSYLLNQLLIFNLKVRLCLQILQ